ncbi:HlyD family secretion protein [Dyella soli]|uniref:HlyD family secretion protein n=1 Tax=Dyella soli TaxID=522319 RepID=A0A4R0YUW5_9GAMM|nr:HlyD family secretion protein [Dyella soli]TCI10322.1 HlyD family secretion protein [Dyella soli]
MEILILGIYSFFVWLVFIKFKWLPWNIYSQVAVVVIALSGITALILVLNVVAPSSNDVRVLNYAVEVVPRVTGRVTEVPIEGNRLIRKGTPILKVDPEPFQIKVNQLQANLVSAVATASQLKQDLSAAHNNTEGAMAQLNLARTRLKQSQQLASSGAGAHYDVDFYESEVKRLQPAYDAAQAAEAKVETELNALVNGEQSSVASMRAQLQQAKWDLSQTVIYAPADGYAINLQVREGSFAAAFPLRPVMTFVEVQQQVVAFYNQNELSQVEPGNEVELALPTVPGKIIKGEVDSVVWATGQGQYQAAGVLPNTPVEEPHAPAAQKYAVKIKITDTHGYFLAMGARGNGAIYTNHGAPIHLVRKVLIRVQSLTNYLILKLH